MDAVFLDRDGVLNEPVFRGSGKPIAPWTLDEFHILDVGEPLNRLKDMGYLLFIVTNQPDIAKGIVDAEVVDEMNAMLLERYPISEAAVCPHADEDGCSCRKPKPGMILSLAEKWNVDLGKSYLIGDNWKDIEAGRNAGATSILLGREYNKGVEADHRAEDLREAVDLMRLLQ